RERQLELFRDPLHRTAGRELERRAQALVARDEEVERAAERRQRQRATQAEGQRDVERRTAGLEAVEHPEALLRERERKRRGTIDGRERHRHRSTAQRLDLLRDSGG